MEAKQFEELIKLQQITLKNHRNRAKKIEEAIRGLKLKVEAEKAVVYAIEENLLDIAKALAKIGLCIKNIFYNTYTNGKSRIDLVCKTNGNFGYIVYKEDKKILDKIIKKSIEVEQIVEQAAENICVEVSNLAASIEEFEHPKNKNFIIMLYLKRQS